MVRDIHSKDRPDTRGGAVLLVLVGLIAVLALVPVGGGIAAFVTGHGWLWPRERFSATLGNLIIHPHDPAGAYPAADRSHVPGTRVFWSVVATLEAMLLLVGAFVAVAVISRRGIYGMLTRRDLKTAMRKAQSPVEPIGSYLGVPVQPRPNDAALVVAPQQSGKTTRLAVSRVKAAPGAAVVSGTKVDILDLTVFLRTDDHRNVHVFDVDRISGWPVKCRWNLVGGCESAQEAATRAAALVAARPETSSSSGNTQFFATQSIIVLKCLLHAAAISGKSMRDVVAWAHNLSDEEPLNILRTDERALPGWDRELEGATRGEARETVASTAMTIAGVLSSLSDPDVLDLVCPPRGEGFNIEEFVRRGCDTLYVLSEGGESVTTAPLVTAFVSSIVSAARRASQHAPGGKLSPELWFILDEVANVAPVPELGMMLSDGGGRGMCTWAFLQSFGQARKRWGRDGWDTMWGATSLKLILPGCTETDDLERISRLVGDRRVREDQGGLDGLMGSSSTNRSRLERIMPVDSIQLMEDGTGLMIYKNVGNALVTLPAWWERPDHAQFADSQKRAGICTGRALKDDPAPTGRARLTGALRDRMKAGSTR